MFFSVALLFLVLVSLIGAREGPPYVAYPILDEHQCNGPGWVADRKSFRASPRMNFNEPGRTYLNGELPYVFSKHIAEGQTATFRGRIDGTFEINFRGGTPVKGDEGVGVLHIENEFGWFRKQTTIGSYLNNQLTNPVKFECPFAKGKNYEIAVTAMNDHFEIRFDKKKILEYQYQAPLDYVNFINIIGETKLTAAYVGGQKFTLPYRIWFPDDGESKSFKKGNRVVLNMILYHTSEPILVNFLATDYIKPNKPNILMQLKVDFDNNRVVMNTWIRSKWGRPDVRNNPFQTDIVQELMVVNEEIGLQIYVDGKHLALFYHDTTSVNNVYEMLQLQGPMDVRSLVVCKN